MNSSPLPIVFFGTDPYAAQFLTGLLESPLVSVELVITQPDKPVGRKMEMTPSAVKLEAERHGIEVVTPETLKNFDRDLTKFDLGIGTRYGKLIPKAVLEGPKHGILNIHPSLLPRWRGATPIQSSLIAGEAITGVTIMKMDEGLDTGLVLIEKEISVLPNDTYDSLSQKLTPISLEALFSVLLPYIDRSLALQKQNDSDATYCKEFTRDDGRVDWNKGAHDIYNQYRGIGHWPGLWTTLQGARVKLHDVLPTTKVLSPGMIETTDEHIFVGTADGSIEILEIQKEGGKRLTATQFLAGTSLDHEKFE